MYFIPCFYCNVSDAWLLSERWKRLWVSFGGRLLRPGALVDRGVRLEVTQPGTAPHDFAWFVVSLCGFRVFFNANPLIKLDGYYVLSDFLEMPT